MTCIAIKSHFHHPQLPSMHHKLIPMDSSDSYCGIRSLAPYYVRLVPAPYALGIDSLHFTRIERYRVTVSSLDRARSLLHVSTRLMLACTQRLRVTVSSLVHPRSLLHPLTRLISPSTRRLPVTVSSLVPAFSSLQAPIAHSSDLFITPSTCPHACTHMPSLLSEGSYDSFPFTYSSFSPITGFTAFHLPILEHSEAYLPLFCCSAAFPIAPIGKALFPIDSMYKDPTSLPSS